MKNKLLLLLVFGLPVITVAQPSSSETNQIMKVSEGFYHLFYDSSTAKSTIIEFEKFVALLEVPIKNEGGGARNLKDHTFGAQKAIASIEKYFPKKPIKYVLHSHWHPHSISSVKPFLEIGATLISTRTNFERIKEFLDSASVVKYRKQIQFVDSDSLVIKDKTNSIVAYRFLQAEYKSTPAKEYLYFYFPKYFALHSGCMYYKWAGDPVDGRDIITDRQNDLNRFIINRKLTVNNFVRINGDKDLPGCLMKGDDFQRQVATGITTTDINELYFSIGTSILNQKQDSIVQLIKSKKIPISILNSNVYSNLRRKDFERALAFAKLQILINPSDANAWDTLGEVNFFMGRTELANVYHTQSIKIEPTFTAGGVTSWERSLKEFENVWSAVSK
jgi:tetratricopeptide (TPR) repeat protein